MLANQYRKPSNNRNVEDGKNKEERLGAINTDNGPSKHTIVDTGRPDPPLHPPVERTQRLHRENNCGKTQKDRHGLDGKHQNMPRNGSLDPQLQRSTVLQTKTQGSVNR